MVNGKKIVLTVFGHERTIDKIAINSFEAGADTYCDTINSLELKDASWVFAKTISDNGQYSLDSLLPVRFGILLDMDDRSVQKIIREVDSQELAKALKGTKEEVQNRIFRNMSVRAAQMLKEDMEYMGPVPVHDVKEAQDKIVMIIRQLHDCGEIQICPKGELVE